ncbi:covalently-linked cell wall protein-like protein [Plenodomus tracheiphilus IPT5]|uniref:Covalently-linked cell wall protein-like protein n=1 Tax=Plenodomus tracheiphilus IPT5 TaxID=1408161 RepID=A0A6A7B6C8_9PLEO|nr:covalently-linked cell wall protein-like protein [Plenodomus tracheiphilus IPT5]
MKSFVALSLAAAAVALPQTSSPEGCASSSSGSFQVSTVNVTSSAKRSIEARQLAGTLTITLTDGELKDQAGRIGYIASNYQFQFDNPVQAGARETSGFSLCGNQSLALGGSTIFYQCLSGDFYNLYSQSTGAQCNQIHIQAVNAPSGGASQLPDGQPQASGAVSQISDGQPQATSAGPAISQISDGQPQAPTGAVSQISDGQVQAPTATAVISQISDGQPQAPTGVVSQISDGQVQAPTATAVISQISDGQPQAPVATGNVTGNATTPPIPDFTGAAATSFASIGALAAGLVGLFAML